jgi:DNA-binding transcriptional LysR family regulator
MLENNEVDIIVTNSPNSALVNSMRIDPIYEFQDVFIGNPEFFKIGKEPLTFDELQKHPILMLTKQSTTSEFLHNLFIQHSLELVPAVELSSNDLLIDLAKIGLGLAFIPDYCLKDEETKLVKVPITEELPIRKLVVAYNENIPLSSVTQYFIELLGK